MSCIKLKRLSGEGHCNLSILNFTHTIPDMISFSFSFPLLFERERKAEMDHIHEEMKSIMKRFVIATVGLPLLAWFVKTY